MGIDIVSFDSNTSEACRLDASLSNVSIENASAGAEEGVYVRSHGETTLSVNLNEFDASNITHSVVRAAAFHSSEMSLAVTHADFSDFDMAGVYVENYVLAEQGDGVSAQVTDSTLNPNATGRGILVNHQGVTPSDFNFSRNTVGETGVQSDGITIYGLAGAEVKAIVQDNVMLSRGAPTPNLPSNITQAPHMPIYIESQMTSAKSCLVASGNSAPAGFNALTDMETASLGIKVGSGGELTLSGWDGLNELIGANQFISEQNPDFEGGSTVNLIGDGVLSGGSCDPLQAMTPHAAQMRSNQAINNLADPVVTIPVLPPGKMITIRVPSVVNAQAVGLDRISAQGVYTVDGLNQQLLIRWYSDEFTTTVIGTCTSLTCSHRVMHRPTAPFNPTKLFHYPLCFSF